MKVAFIDDNQLLAVGFDHNPTVYAFGGSDDAPEWKEDRKLDPEVGEAKRQTGSSAMMARNIFMAADSRGIKKDAASEEKPINTIHKNNIV